MSSHASLAGLQVCHSCMHKAHLHQQVLMRTCAEPLDCNGSPPPPPLHPCRASCLHTHQPFSPGGPDGHLHELLLSSTPRTSLNFDTPRSSAGLLGNAPTPTQHQNSSKPGHYPFACPLNSSNTSMPLPLTSPMFHHGTHAEPGCGGDRAPEQVCGWVWVRACGSV